MFLHSCAIVWEKMEKQHLNKNSLCPCFMCGKNCWVGAYYFALYIIKSACRNPCGKYTIHILANKLQSNACYHCGCMKVIADICFLLHKNKTKTEQRLQTPCRT